MNSKYSWQQIILHWISAAIIIWATLSGFYVALFTVSPAIKDGIGFFNVSLTTVFIPIFILRVFFLFKHGKPVKKQQPTVSSHIAHAVHLLLYLNIAAVLISGVLMMERDINVFNILSIPKPFDDLKITQLFNSFHIFSCATLAGLVLLHIMAVVKHSLLGNRILRNMWF
ncbi:cytochrome B [Pantoea sp. LS15]|nr:cytochrome B [Pantoea sp. LS15]NKF48418.1 cytochrome B [Pantoea sp. LS15]RDK12999.1 cytochrome B [Enterobacter sp. 9-2]